MKKFILTLAILTSSITAFSQVGVGTTTPATGTALHIDGAKDNTSTTPTAIEAVNDVVIMNDGKVGIGTTSPNTSAALDVTSTTRGFLPPRMTQLQMNDIAPTEGLVVYCTDCTPKGLYVNNGSTFLSSGISADTPTPVAGEILRPTGKIWMDKNLGAASVATSSTDNNGYGHLFQWGRKADGHEVLDRPNPTEANNTTPSGTSGTAAGPVANNSQGTTFITVAAAPYDWLDTPDDNRWSGEGSANDPCPAGYRVPSDYEWQAERNTWSSKNSAGAFAALKLPVAGFRSRIDGALLDVGSTGAYWSSTVSGTGARRLRFTSGTATIATNGRSGGFSVRCIKD